MQRQARRFHGQRIGGANGDDEHSSFYNHRQSWHFIDMHRIRRATNN